MRDDTKNGCVAEYCTSGVKLKKGSTVWGFKMRPLAVLTSRFFLQENVWPFSPAKKSGRNNEVPGRVPLHYNDYINTKQITGELSSENMKITSHVERSRLLWLRDKSRL